MSRPAAQERIANVAFGLNAWLWAVLGIATSQPADRLTVSRCCIALLHTLVGIMFLRRATVRRSGCKQQLAAALPSLVLSGLVFSCAAGPSDWNPVANALFLTGTVIALCAFFSLRENFAVLPALRGVTTSGLYRVVRHPAYFGELLLVAGCVASKPGPTLLLLLAASLAAVIFRIRAEEQLLSRSEDYAQYAAHVKHRLLPGGW